MGDHDNLFKRAFSVPAHAAGEIRSVLPPSLSAKVDLSSLQLEPASFVDAQMAQRHADLLFSATIAGRRGFVYFLFEHQAAPDPLMPWRVLTYQQRIWAECLREDSTRRTLPPIVTIIVHHGEQGWAAPRRLHDVIDGIETLPELRPFVPAFELVVDDLVAVDDPSLQGRPLAPFPKISLWLLRDGRSVDVFLSHLAEWAEELERLVLGRGVGDDYVTVLRYIWRVVGEGPEDLVRRRLVELAPKFGEAMPSYDERLIEKGVEKGIEKGIEQGREQGRREAVRDMLERLLRSRFGVESAAARDRMTAATVDELEGWFQRALVAERIDDVFES